MSAVNMPRQPSSRAVYAAGLPSLLSSPLRCFAEYSSLGAPSQQPVWPEQLIKLSCMIDDCRSWETINSCPVQTPDCWLEGPCLVSMNVRVGLQSSPVVLETVCNDNLMFRTKYVVVDLYVRQCLAHHRSCYTETENSLTRSDTLISSTQYCLYYIL